MKKFNKVTLSMLAFTVLAGCGTNISNNPDTMGLDNSFQINRVTKEFANNVETDEILIDDEYYKQYPDNFLANEVINQLQSGIIPQYPEQLEKDNEVKSQSFLSIFNRKAVIDIFDSYGTTHKFSVVGRVYKKKSIKPPMAIDGTFRNIFRNIKYFTPDPISNTEIKVIVDGVSRVAKTDKKGYFKVGFEALGVQPGVNNVTAQIVGSKYKYEAPKEQVVIDNDDSDKVAIVSDIDDTVKYTEVHKKFKMLKLLFTGNYRTDKPYLGVSSLYRGIIGGPMGRGVECMHYVTGSPANLYTRIQDFLKLNKYPQGSIDLKKGGSTVDPNPSATFDYKVSKIRPIMNAYPNKKFVFFGDNTQKDPEVYKQIKKEFPDRVLGIYINNVVHEDPNDPRQLIKDDPKSPRYEGILVTNSAIDAAQDLFKKGILSQDSLDKVITDVKY